MSAAELQRYAYDRLGLPMTIVQAQKLVAFARATKIIPASTRDLLEDIRDSAPAHNHDERDNPWEHHAKDLKDIAAGILEQGK